MKINFKVSLPHLEGSSNKIKEKGKKVLFTSMQKMEELAKRYCPVDTGLLRRSINLTPKTFGSDRYSLADGVEYGYMVEYGTSAMVKAHGKHDPLNPVTDWKAKKERRAVGQMMPFFRPALIEVRQVWFPEYVKQLRLQRK